MGQQDRERELRTMRLRTLWLSIAIVVAFAACTLASAAERYRVYANARFGTTAEIPAGWIAGPEPANGDGLRFRSPDGRGTITVSGNLHIWDSVDEGIALFDERDKDEKVTYRQRDGRNLVVSGTRGDEIFYERHILSCGDQIWNNLRIAYPAREKAAYDALVTHVSRSLRPGRSGQVPNCR